MGRYYNIVMRTKEEYDALLRTFLSCASCENPEQNPYFIWLANRLEDPNRKNETSFLSFVKDSIQEFYKS